jgi:hypothetical protein
MTIQTAAQNTKSNRLRRILQANGLFSGLSGFILTVDSRPVASFLGLDTPIILVVIGVSLMLYAGALFQQAAQDPINPQFVTIAIIMDVAWVIGSIIILLTDLVPLSTGGMWAVAIVADIVAVFAVLQFYSLRRSKK